MDFRGILFSDKPIWDELKILKNRWKGAFVFQLDIDVSENEVHPKMPSYFYGKLRYEPLMLFPDNATFSPPHFQVSSYC